VEQTTPRGGITQSSRVENPRTASAVFFSLLRLTGLAQFKHHYRRRHSYRLLAIIHGYLLGVLALNDESWGITETVARLLSQWLHMLYKLTSHQLIQIFPHAIYFLSFSVIFYSILFLFLFLFFRWLYRFSQFFKMQQQRCYSSI
jgi:hypothetical protein